MMIFLSTPHAEYRIRKWGLNQTLIEICNENQIPHQSVSIYGKRGKEISLIIGLHNPISEFVAVFDKIIIKADRNINYKSVANKRVKVSATTHPTTEYTFPSHDGEELHHIEFSQDDCRRLVVEKVAKFLKNEGSSG